MPQLSDAELAKLIKAASGPRPEKGTSLAGRGAEPSPRTVTSVGDPMVSAPLAQSNLRDPYAQLMETLGKVEGYSSGANRAIYGPYLSHMFDSMKNRLNKAAEDLNPNKAPLTMGERMQNKMFGQLRPEDMLSQRAGGGGSRGGRAGGTSGAGMGRGPAGAGDAMDYITQFNRNKFNSHSNYEKDIMDKLREAQANARIDLINPDAFIKLMSLFRR